jgi:hypothetical protein
MIFCFHKFEMVAERTGILTNAVIKVCKKCGKRKKEIWSGGFRW